VREREAAVREAAKTHNFAGYDYSPLEEHKVVDFVDKLHELVRKAESDYKRLQVSLSYKRSHPPADSQSEGARKERAIQAELDRLAGVKTSALATKRSKQDQIVCRC
jgi:DNA repair protein RAD50